MAATLFIEGSIPGPSGAHLYYGKITMDNSYPTGGEAIDAPGDKGFSKMWLTPAGAVASNGVVGLWDAVNQKVIAVWGNAGTASQLPEVTATTDLSATVFDFLAIGPGPVSGG